MRLVVHLHALPGELERLDHNLVIAAVEWASFILGPSTVQPLGPQALSFAGFRPVL